MMNPDSASTARVVEVPSNRSEPMMNRYLREGRRGAGAGRSLFPMLLCGFVLAGCDRGGPDLSDFPYRAAVDGEPVVEGMPEPPAFEDVPAVPEGGGPPAAVDLESHPRARTFRTALTRGAAEGPNFAGHYTVVAWGCGSMCQDFMIVDSRTGEVFDGRTTALGVEHRLESRLLVLNPPARVEESGCLAPECATQYLLWTGSRLEAVTADEERDAIRLAAADHVRQATAVERVVVEIDAVAGDWARVRVVPAGGETDPAVLYLRRQGAAWRAVALGTGFTPEDLDALGVPVEVRPGV